MGAPMVVVDEMAEKLFPPTCQHLPKGTPRAERLAAHRAKMERKWLARQRRNAPFMLQTLARLRERVASEAERGEGRAAEPSFGPGKLHMLGPDGSDHIVVIGAAP